MTSIIHLLMSTCWTGPTTSPTTDVPTKNIVTVTIDSYDGDLGGLAADFTDELIQVLTDNGINDVFIKIVDISYTSDDG